MNMDELRDKILKYKNIIEKNEIYQSFNEEQKAVITLLLFFKNNRERIETLSITKEINSIFPKLSPLEPRNITHIQTLIYVCEEQEAADIEYNKPMSRQEITKKLNNIISVKSLDQSYGYIKN